MRCKECGRYEGKEHKCPDVNPMQGVRRLGKISTNWKGGRVVINGYAYLYSPNHPNKIFGRYVQEHRLVMEKKIGRLLSKQEIVHHKDENTLNNSIDNLEIVTRAEHNKIHKTKKKDE